MIMKKISRGTLFYKGIFPVIWFGAIGLALCISLFAARRPPWPVMIPPLVLLPLGYVLMRRLVYDLADEVWDCGDHLVVKQRGQQESVPFSNIMNVSASLLVNPPRVTLRLVRPGRFGDEISFMPPRPVLYNPFARNPLVDDLVERAYRARSAVA